MEKRPNLFSKEVVAAVTEDILPKVIEWLDEGETSPEELEHIKDQVNHALEHGMSDAYESVRYLESHYYWSVNSELVNIFDDAGWKFYEFRDEFVTKWVTDNLVKPELPMGAKVTFYADGKNRTGEIVQIREATAEYTVFCEELGHTLKPDKARGGFHTTGAIIPFERVSAV